MNCNSARLTFGSVFFGMLLFACTGLMQAQDPRADYQQAVAYIKQGQWEAAIEPLQRVLKQTPDNIQILNLLGVALSSSGRRAEANEQFRKVLAANPSFHSALKNMAVNEMLMGQTREAEGHFKELLQYAPDDPVAHLALADVAFAAKDYSAAVEHFERSRAMHEADPRARVRFARSYKETGQVDKALALLDKLPAEADAATCFEAGLLQAEAGKFTEAVRFFERAKAGGYPDAYQLGFNLTLAYFEAKQYPQAVAAGEAVIAQGQTTAELYNLLARSYEEAGDTKKAYDALRTATQLDPADPANYIDLIDICLEHNSIDLGLEIADIAVERLPGSQRLRLQRGVVLAMKGRFDDSKASFDKAVELAPDNGLVHVALALIYMQMDRVPEAVEVLRARKGITPDDPLVHWFLGEALNRQGTPPGSPEEEEAVAALERAVELQMDLQQAQVLLGKMLLRRGDLDRAATHLEIALKIDPDNLAAVYQLAQVRQKQGNREAAKELFGRVQEAKTEAREEFTKGGLLRIVREGAK